jgi:hypothetical protein
VFTFNNFRVHVPSEYALLPELSQSSVQRSLKSAVKAGALIKAGHGKYEKPHMVNMVTPYRDDHVDHVPEVFTQKEDRDHWPEWGKNGRDHIEVGYLDAIDR